MSKKNKNENIDLNLELFSSDNNIIIYNDYQNCNNILEQNDDSKNEFIIVNDKFLSFLKISDFENKEVEIKKVNSKNKIIFPASQYFLLLDKKSQYSFKFSKSKESIMANKIKENKAIIRNQKEEKNKKNLLKGEKEGI